MLLEQVALLGAAVFLVALVAKPLKTRPVTTAMVFVAFGFAAGPDGLGLLHLEVDDGGVLLLAEVTLALLLFSDATRIDLRALREGIALPARLLGVGLPLTIALGTAIVVLVLQAPLGTALVVAAVLAPTDAALGQAVVSDERVPIAIRQGLNVESGLNDGLVLPVVTVGLAMVADQAAPGALGLVGAIVGGVTLGAAVGASLTAVLGRVRASIGLDAALEQLATLSIVAITFGLAHWFGVNGFLAAFAAGLAVRGVAGQDARRLTAYTEDTAQLAAFIAFVIFGALLLPDALAATTVAIVVCAVLALTVMRMLPVGIALLGTGVRLPTTLFCGWFGPRGLASILLGLLVLEELGTEQTPLPAIGAVVGWTVLLSVVAHGATAAPLAARYATWFEGGLSKGHDLVEADETSRPLLRWQRRE